MANAASGGYANGMTTKDDARAERLAAALRDNLRRRKGQAREAKATAPVPAITPEPDAP